MIRITLAADQLWHGILYPQGTVEVPDELAIALALNLPIPHAPNPDQTQAPEPDQATPQQSPPPQALMLLNTAATPRQLTPLPKIGEGAGKRLIANRPTEGYESLEQAIALNPELAKAPYRVDWDAIATWQPESGVPE